MVATPKSSLIRLDERFRDYPAQAVDVRIANFVPADYDDEWDNNSLRTINEWLHEAMAADNVHIEGTIRWSAILDTIWLDKLYVLTKLPTCSKVIKLNIHRNLLEKKFAIEDTKCLQEMQANAAACGIVDEGDVIGGGVEAKNHAAAESNSIVCAMPPARARVHGNRLSRPSTRSSSSSSSAMHATKNKVNNGHLVGVSSVLPMNEWSNVSILNFYTTNYFFVQSQL